MRVALLALVCGACAQGAESSGPVSTSTGWLRPTPAGAMAAIYFTVRNPSAAPLVLTSVRVDGVAHSTFHESSEHAGMSHMSDRDSLVVPARDSVVFAPRGLHIMAHGVPKALATGDSLTVRLSVRDGPPLQLQASVRDQ